VSRPVAPEAGPTDPDGSWIAPRDWTPWRGLEPARPGLEASPEAPGGLSGRTSRLRSATLFLLSFTLPPPHPRIPSHKTSSQATSRAYSRWAIAHMSGDLRHLRSWAWREERNGHSSEGGSGAHGQGKSAAPPAESRSSRARAAEPQVQATDQPTQRATAGIRNPARSDREADHDSTATSSRRRRGQRRDRGTQASQRIPRRFAHT
jgi:hypothetical protein